MINFNKILIIINSPIKFNETGADNQHKDTKI